MSYFASPHRRVLDIRKNLLPDGQRKEYHALRADHIAKSERALGRKLSPAAEDLADDWLMTAIQRGSPFGPDEYAEYLGAFEAVEVENYAQQIRTREAASQLVEAEKAAQTGARRFSAGGEFVFDRPTEIPAWWGRGQEVIGADGESLIICGPPGVGKTTLTGQLVRGLLGLRDEVLGYPVRPTSRKVLYLAMDRPQQIGRSLARHFTPDERQAMNDRLVVWTGPPPGDLAVNTDLLRDLCVEADADVVIVDSLKDAAVGLVKDDVGAGWNRARQTALADGVQVIELHHVIKKGDNAKAPKGLADLYGSAWIASGAGSVVLLHGQAGDSVVEFIHLKQPAEPVGPMKIIHDHARGETTVFERADPMVMLEQTGNRGLTVHDLAAAMFDGAKIGANESAKARYKLDSLVKRGLLVKQTMPNLSGGRDTHLYSLPPKSRQQVENQLEAFTADKHLDS